MELNCIVCGKVFIRYGKQILTAKTCSKKCLGKFKKAKPNTVCTQCNKNFHLKESSKKRYKRTHGYFCSTECVANFRKDKYLGKGNPNFRKQVNRSTDGYKLDYLPKFGRIKLHHKVTFETLGINKIPKNYCVHHRDCNIDNNSPENLVLISQSDHRWLHKQFGNATLWAYINGKVTLDELLKWTNNINYAKRLLPLNLLDQKKSGVFKSGDFMLNPKVQLIEVDELNETKRGAGGYGSTGK